MHRQLQKSIITGISDPTMGASIKLHSDSNKVRRIIVAILDRNRAEVATHIRASKGYRRHVRRMKAKA